MHDGYTPSLAESLDVEPTDIEGRPRDFNTPEFCNPQQFLQSVPVDTKGQWYTNLKQWRLQCQYYSIFLYVSKTHLAALNMAYVMILGLALPRVKAQV